MVPFWYHFFIFFYFCFIVVLVGGSAHAIDLSTTLWALNGGTFMNLTVIIFFCGLGAYFIGLTIFVLIKRYRNKKAFKKELEAKKNEEAQDHNINA